MLGLTPHATVVPSHHGNQEAQRMTQNIFVLGLDEPGHSELAALPHAGWCSFHGILTLEDLQDGLISLTDLLEQAEE